MKFQGLTTKFSKLGLIHKKIPRGYVMSDFEAHLVKMLTERGFIVVYERLKNG